MADRFLHSLEAHPIQKPESGKRVTRWQQLLKSKGFVVVVDGIFGPKTVNATKVAQHWAGVADDGLVGPLTWKAFEAKKRTKRPITTARHVLQPVVPGLKPKIIDCRHGKHGFPHHRTREWQKRARSEIRAKLGHYTGGPASFLADAKFHVFSDYLDEGGAPAIAYHLGVDKDGTILLFNDWNDVTWHCDGGKNTVTLGYVFRGGAEGPTLAQKASLKWLLRALEHGTFGFSYPAMPAASTTHRHVNSTSCPGEKGEAFYRSVASDFRTRL